MRKIVTAAALALTLTGCITTAPFMPGYIAIEPLKTGNHLQAATVLKQQELANEAVKQLVTIWLPAKTQFELQHSTPDAFGMELVRRLRENGYALLEFNPEQVKKADQSPVQTDANDSQVFPLSYVLDQADNTNFYRLTLIVGVQSLSRPYLVQDNEFVPAGCWTYKESPLSSGKGLEK